MFTARYELGLKKNGLDFVSKWLKFANASSKEYHAYINHNCYMYLAHKVLPSNFSFSDR